MSTKERMEPIGRQPASSNLPRRRMASLSEASAAVYDDSPSTFREDVYAAALEFCGTILFLLLAFGGTQSAISAAVAPGYTPASYDSVLIYASASFGLALLVSVWIFYRVTGGVFNPNVSLALLLSGAINPVRFALYCVALLVGAIVASALIQAMLPGPLQVNTVPSNGTSKTQAVFIEMFITAALCFSVLMFAVEKHRITAFAPIGIGLTLFAGELWGIQYTGGSMNTARSFGPAVVSGFDSSHWIYWLGPIMGSILAAALYRLLKLLRYERLNPGQDEGEIVEAGLATQTSGANTDPATNSGVNALRVSTQMANVNGQMMMVAQVPFMALPHPHGMPYSKEEQQPHANLTLVLNDSPTAIQTGGPEYVTTSPTGVRYSVATQGTAVDHR